MYILNKINGKIPRSGVIYPEIINPHDLCYQFSKNGLDSLFGKFNMKEFNDEPHSLKE